jgi:hypothetical protein
MRAKAYHQRSSKTKSMNLKTRNTFIPHLRQFHVIILYRAITEVDRPTLNIALSILDVREPLH